MCPHRVVEDFSSNLTVIVQGEFGHTRAALGHFRLDCTPDPRNLEQM
jgi:hypothetical protein